VADRIPIPIPIQPTALRRAADHLEARAEVALQQAKGGTETERRAHNARANELRTLARIKRGQADAIDTRSTNG
jgi:hypothetical protein